MRDDFRKPVIHQIAQRAGFKCSNQSCRRPTMGPDGGTDTASIGVAAHITAASEGGPRFDESLTPEERSAAENGIWLCQTCSRLIDVDVPSHPVEKLREWKTLAEMRAYLGLRGYRVVIPRDFEQLEKKMPELVEEMRKDINNHPFVRRFRVSTLAPGSTAGNEEEVAAFSYYTHAHPSLAGKLAVCENYGAISELYSSGRPTYVFTEDFVEYLEEPR